jgi:predicted MFS family arabinose efflux permease
MIQRNGCREYDTGKAGNAKMGIPSKHFYSLAAICMAAGAMGSAILAPFFMREKGFSIALAGIPLVANGVGALCSDVISGTLASYFRSSFLLLAAVSIAIVASILGYVFQDSLTVFLVAFSVLGLTEAMFSLAIRRIVFVQSSADQQGKAQGQVAAALGIGFALGPTFGGFVGEWWGPDKLFLVYAVPQSIGLVLLVLARGHRVEKPVERSTIPLWRVGKGLLNRGAFMAACLAMFQSFCFLIGVTRIGFPFLAVRRGLAL